MLRATLHLSELLQTQPKGASADNETGSGPEWSPKRKFKPTKYHLVNISKLKRATPQVLPEAVPQRTLDLHAAKLSYDRCLSSGDSAQTIRLLNVLPGSRDEDLVCNLHYVSLLTPPYYEAISYCWGAQIASVKITCDGQSVAITKNLSDALLRVRRKHESVFVWADAVCIDQESIQEKNSQIPLMSLIYRKAAAVKVWLGEDTPKKSCQEAFHVLRALVHARATLGWDFDFARKQPAHDSNIQHNIPALGDSSWQSVNDLLQKPWFGRAWIIQEIVASQHATLYCGDAALPWTDFHLGVLFAMHSGFLFYQFNVMFLFSAYQRLIPLLVTYGCVVDPERSDLDLISLLESHRSAGATDPRDKVYALSGLLSAMRGRVNLIQPDYSMTTADVYIEVAKTIIRESDDLDILGVPHVTGSLAGDLPSWVPDWSIGSVTNALSFRTTQGSYMYNFDAANTHKTPRNVEFRGKSLVLQGHVFDVVADVGAVMNPLEHPTPDGQTSVVLGMAHVMAVSRDWRSLCKRLTLAPSYIDASETIETVVFRTICLNDFEGDREVAGFISANHRLKSRFLMAAWSCALQHRFPVKMVRSFEIHLAKWALLRRVDRDFSARNTVYKSTRAFGRSMIATKGGYLGLGPAGAQFGDNVVLVKGSRVPLVFRSTQQSKWILIGDCYLHGIMHGEAFDEQSCAEMEIL